MTPMPSANAFRHRWFYVAFPLSTSLIGTFWARSMVNSLKTGDAHHAMLSVGFLAGLALGVLTLWLWRPGTCTS